MYSRVYQNKMFGAMFKNRRGKLFKKNPAAKFAAG
jgi:hypothetical protein